MAKRCLTLVRFYFSLCPCMPLVSFRVDSLWVEPLATPSVCQSPCQPLCYFSGLNSWPRDNLSNAVLGERGGQQYEPFIGAIMWAVLFGPCHCLSLLGSKELMVSVLHIILQTVFVPKAYENFRFKVIS